MKTPQEKIQEILNQCSTENYIFRGESQKHDKVSSGLYRQYCQPDNNSDSNTHPKIVSKYFSVFTVEKDIVEKIKQHIRLDAPNIEVLTELQHYGGKTALLDFSKNVHVALFFACDGNFEEDGRVILSKTSELPEHKDIDYKNLSENKSKNIYTLISPTGKSSRAIFQSSIFIHASQGYLEEDTYEIITIEKDLKKPLLEYLRKNFNIRTETIYNDIQGFVRNQHNYATAEIEFYRGTQEKNPEKAIKHYNKAIGLNPQLAEAYNNRGVAYDALKQHQKAINDYDKAIDLNPQSAEAYNNRGAAYSDLKQHQKAINDCDKAIDLNPQDADAYNNRGNAYRALGEYPEAINDYNETIKLDPQSAEAYYNRGIAYSDLKKYPEAINDYSDAKTLFEKAGNIAMVESCEREITKLKGLL